MMQLIGLALSAAVLALLLRRHHPEFSMVISLAACLFLFLYAARHFITLKAYLDGIASRCGIQPALMNVLYKVVGAAYLGQIAAALCRDAGESALASALELCTKLTVLLLSLPLLTSLFDRLAGIAEAL